MERKAAQIIGVVAAAATFSAITAGTALAQTGLVDGSITAMGNTCSWTKANTSDVPPNKLTIDGATVNSSLNCTGGVTAKLNNSPTVTFDDAGGKATVDKLDVTIVASGQTCQYAVRNASATREGTTRHYTSSTQVQKVSGGLLCPATVDTTGDFTFH